MTLDITTNDTNVATILIGSEHISSSALSGTVVTVTSKAELSSCLKNYPPKSFKSIHLIIHLNKIKELYDPLALANFLPKLSSSSPENNGNEISIQVLGSTTGTANNNQGGDYQPIHTSFLLAGLTLQSEKKEVDSRTFVSQTKKETQKQNGKKIKISLPTSSATNDDDDDDFIDEDNLLSSNLLAPPPNVDIEQRKKQNLDDCGGRKACDDCTCGRAELEKQQKQQDSDSVVVPSSSCGNCSKGDAFRCAGCPFLGKPAFKPGEEHLVLELVDDI